VIQHQLAVVVDNDSGAVPILWHRGISYEDVTLPMLLLDQAGDYREWKAKINPFEKSTYETALISIPGQHSIKDYDYLNELAAKFKKVVFFITGDEEALFCADQLKHANSIKWWFAPPFNPAQRVERVAPFGPTRATFHLVHQAYQRLGEYRQRDFDWCFLGQVTHERREQCALAARPMQRGMWFGTDGFFKGVPQNIYFDMFVRSKFVLCPSGPNTPDSFRFAEALEAGCIPIVDGLSPKRGYPRGYWGYVTGENEGDLPFPVIYDWSELPRIFPGLLKGWGVLRDRCDNWWNSKKQTWAHQLRRDLWSTKS
jgi:hypothetical protein